LPGVFVHTLPGGQKSVLHSDEPLQAGPQPHGPPSSPVQTSPGMQAPAHEGAVPPHFDRQPHTPAVIVQTCPGGQKRLAHCDDPPQAGPQPQAPPSSPVQTSSVGQSPAHAGAVPPQGAASTGPRIAIASASAAQTASNHFLPDPVIIIGPPPMSARERVGARLAVRATLSRKLV